MLNSRASQLRDSGGAGRPRLDLPVAKAPLRWDSRERSQRPFNPPRCSSR